MIKILQGNTLTVNTNAWSSEDYRHSTLQENQLVHAIVLNFKVTIATAAVNLVDVLKHLDIRVKKDSNKTLYDLRGFDLKLMEMLDNKSQNLMPQLAVGAHDFYITIPFYHPGRTRPKDSSLCVKTCRSLSIELQYRALANTTMRATADTAIMYENIGNSIFINSERYALLQSLDMSGAVANRVFSVDRYPYTRCIIQADANLANITRLEVMGDNGIMYQGEPDEIQQLSKLIQRQDLDLEYLLAPTPVSVNGECIVLPFLHDLTDSMAQVEATKLAIGYFTAGAVTANMLLESISSPSTRRIERQIKLAYPSLPATSIMLGAVNADGSVEYNPTVWASRNNLPSFKAFEKGSQSIGGKTQNADEVLKTLSKS